ncbi:hypothetical protein [Roseburia sp. 499]|uniref:hypothetical protein n=1 Tax=Roseburia sp. 499 TaxID=1261634 RepID=UPI0009528CF6|nr:hypothetical protein [Roseburia sp. 499]WVK69424.1 hypothetical protein BIV20_13830 [Roseburia sp. 499]
MKYPTTLEKKLERLQKGFPCEDSYAIAEVEKSANITLETYFAQCPEKLEQLKEIISISTDNMGTLTYMDAAMLINQELLFGNRQKGLDMLSLLTEPLHHEYNRRVKLHEKAKNTV